MKNETTMTNETTHVFEKAGLGKAPFKFIGCEERRGPYRYYDPQTGITTEIGSPGQPMGVCDFCGQGIAVCCVIRSADGKEFIVGTDCVLKTGDAGLRRSVNAKKAQARREKGFEKIDEGREFVEANRAAVDSLPGPRFGTLGSWFDWMMKNAGNSGKLRAIRNVREALAITANKA